MSHISSARSVLLELRGFFPGSTCSLDVGIAIFRDVFLKLNGIVMVRV